jgi:hypothetical protein
VAGDWRLPIPLPKWLDRSPVCAVVVGHGASAPRTTSPSSGGGGRASAGPKIPGMEPGREDGTSQKNCGHPIAFCRAAGLNREIESRGRESETLPSATLLFSPKCFRPTGSTCGRRNALAGIARLRPSAAPDSPAGRNALDGGGCASPTRNTDRDAQWRHSPPFLSEPISRSSR